MKEPDRRPIGFRATKDEIRTLTLAAALKGVKRDQLLRESALKAARKILTTHQR